MHQIFGLDSSNLNKTLGVFGNTLRKLILFDVGKSIFVDEEARKSCFFV